MDLASSFDVEIENRLLACENPFSWNSRDKLEVREDIIARLTDRLEEKIPDAEWPYR